MICRSTVRMQSSSCSHVVEEHVAQYRRGTWTSSINRFSSTISWEGSLSGKQTPLFEAWPPVKLILHISPSSFMSVFSSSHSTFLPRTSIPPSLSLFSALLFHSPPSCSFTIFISSPRLWFVAGVSLSVRLGELRASVSCYSSPSPLIKPCIVNNNPTITIRIFIPCPLLALLPHT